MSQAQPGAADQRDLVRMVGRAAVIGVVAASAGSLLLEVIHVGESFLFDTLPGTLGIDGSPWWWAAVLLLIGATGVALARRLPGATGGGPLTGFHFDDPLSVVPSVLLAALSTLAFGFVLGPEAPLIVLGTAVGALLARNAEPRARQAAMLLGGVAAIGAVFGNPFVTAFMVLEFAAFGLVPAALLPGALVALATGYLTQIGIAGLPGFGVHSLSVPGLPEYDTVLPIDLVVGLLVAAASGVLAVAVRASAVAVDRVAQRRVIPMLYVTAIVTAVVLAVAQLGFGVAQDQILFSGQSGMGALVQQTSATVVLVIVLCKGIAYAFALGGGTRGGPIFPATFLGVAVAVLVSLLVPDASVSPLAAAGIAAASSAIIKMPGTSALLAALLVAGSGAAVAPFAIIGAIVGLIIRVAVDARLARNAATPAAGTATGTATGTA
jgi:chloride channel protein, CIC family